MNIEDLASKIAKNPGLTKRNAQKLLFHFVRNKEKIIDFTKVFETLEKEVCLCEICGNIAFSKLCLICSNTKREHSTVCIVEDFEDISNLEKGMWYNGVYHVLGGLLSAQRGMMPENINISELITRIQSGTVQEIIFASTSSFEWQATIHLILAELKKLSNFSQIRITEFAHGLPIGSSFEYMDEGTLQIAFAARKAV